MSDTPLPGTPLPDAALRDKPPPADAIGRAPRAGVFLLPLRVYWEDTDAGGVVFYANYLKFFERARTEWLRALGFSQQQMLQHDGVMFVVADTSVRYLRAARLDDLLQVSVEVAEAGRASLRLQQQARRDGELLAEGAIRIGCVAAAAGAGFRPCRIPAAILEKIQ
ncbi:MAG TPA: tol-pal system-associated acyl-CoA thioesterase [Rubrivivax sp.]|nr:tol-pal system-associated acyl-CoA thioesterase [Rubrivivax sp.]